MIYGVGCDMCQVERIAQKLAGPHGARFAARVYGPAEQQALGLPLGGPPAKHQAESAAADFAAKEAFLKAAGVGLSGFALPDIEAVRQESGAPAYRLHGAAAEWLAAEGLRASLSLSHEGGMALAFCVLEKEGRG